MTPRLTINKAFAIQATENPKSCILFLAQVPTGSSPAGAMAALLDSPQASPMCALSRCLPDPERCCSFDMRLTDSYEDCLYFNVPRPANMTRKSKLPVVAWIHEGGFALGPVSMYSAFSIVSWAEQFSASVLYVAMICRWWSAKGFCRW